jgi:hypothetical protein
MLELFGSSCLFVTHATHEKMVRVRVETFSTAIFSHLIIIAHVFEEHTMNDIYSQIIGNTIRVR